MKRKITLTIIIFLIVGIALILVTNKDTEIEKDGEIFKNKENNFISIMLQDEKGNYEQSNITEFNPEGYHYNSYLSKCVNGSTIKYEDGSIYVKGNTSDRCYAYYDNNNFVEDLSGNGNYGKTVNNTIWSNEGITTNAKDNNSFINMGFINYDFKNAISFVIRVKVNDTRSLHYLIGNQQSGGGGLTSKFFELYINGKYNKLAYDNQLSPGNWYTVIGTYDGNHMLAYINGILQKNTIDVSNNIGVSPAPLVIGGNPNESQKITDPGYATFSDALVFKRALTTEEIAKDYTNEINPTNKDDLLLWYKFV